MHSNSRKRGSVWVLSSCCILLVTIFLTAPLSALAASVELAQSKKLPDTVKPPETIKPREIIINPRLEFGEPNQTPESAFPLDLTVERYEGAVTEFTDHDYYKITAGGTFGSCLQFTVLPSAEDLVVNFIGPGGGTGLVYTSAVTTSKWWICLERGAEMFLLVRARHEPLGPIKFYNFSIVEHDLSAGVEGGKLTEGGTTAYMCAVLNQAGTMVAHWDLYSFDHEHCIKDCVMASIPLEITFDPDNVGGVEKDNEWFCNSCFSGELGCGSYTGYVKFIHPDATTFPGGDRIAFDHGEIPDRCLSPYSIQFGHDETDCVFGDCEVGCR